MLFPKHHRQQPLTAWRRKQHERQAEHHNAVKKEASAVSEAPQTVTTNSIEETAA